MASTAKKFRHPVLLVLAMFAAAGGSLWLALQGCQPTTRIAERQLYTGAAAHPLTGGQDWPRWMGPRSDGIAPAASLSDAWPSEGPRRLWSADVGLGFSSPVAARGVVYLFSLSDDREALTAFDAGSGRIIWNVEEPASWTGSYQGTRATPAIAGEFIYTLGAGGDLLCRNVSDGAVVWRANALSAAGARFANLDWGAASSPLAADDLIFVQGGHDGPAALAFDHRDGGLVWTSAAQGPASYAAPILIDVAGTQQLIVFAGAALYGLNPATGATIWSYPWPTSYGVNGSTPVYRDGKLFITSAYGQGCAMLQVEPRGVTKLWENKNIESRFQPTILDGNNLFANSEGTLKCMSWPDGAIKWQARQPRLGKGGSLLRTGDQLFTLSERGELTLGRTAPDGFVIQAQTDLFDASQAWATPLLYGGRLYVKGEREFFCLEVGPPPAAATTGQTAAAQEGN